MAPPDGCRRRRRPRRWPMCALLAAAIVASSCCCLWVPWTSHSFSGVHVSALSSLVPTATGGRCYVGYGGGIGGTGGRPSASCSSSLALFPRGRDIATTSGISISGRGGISSSSRSRIGTAALPGRPARGSAGMHVLVALHASHPAPAPDRDAAPASAASASEEGAAASAAAAEAGGAAVGGESARGGGEEMTGQRRRLPGLRLRSRRLSRLLLWLSSSPSDGDGGGGSNNASSGATKASSSSSSTVDLQARLALMEQENSILRSQIVELERENSKLEEESHNVHAHALSPEQIVIERFEGERLPLFDVNGVEILPWYRDDDDDEEGVKGGKKGGPNGSGTGVGGGVGGGGGESGLTIVVGDESARMVAPASSPSAAAAVAAGASQKSGTTSATATTATNDVDDDDDDEQCDIYDSMTCPIEPDVSFPDALRDRAYWLCGLLAMQSLSGFILSRNEVLLQNHPVIIYFLTMLVGAGGNAGNQASVRVIRGLALGTLNDKTQRQFLNRELKMAVALCGILSTAGFVRAAVFRTPLPETIAITASLALIVLSSIGLGAVLPLLLQKLKVDPAHSSTTIQVVMDILGVVMTVAVSTAMLDSPVGQFIISKLS